MGTVKVVVRIMPRDPGAYEALKEEVEGNFSGYKKEVEERPVAFGLKALILTVFVPDEEGVMEDIEKRLSSLSNAGSWEIEKTTLI